MSDKFSSRRQLTDQEEAEVQSMIASDPDNPELTDSQAAKRQSFAQAFPDLAESIKRSRGRPRLVNAKQAITLRLDPEIVERFKAKGDDWRSQMAQALKDAS